MSSAFWQTERQREQYSTGKESTQKVSDYVTAWKARCYCDDIPDEVSPLLEKTNRVPSYKAIAKAILRNDHCFKSLGFSKSETALSSKLMQDSKLIKSKQISLL